MKKKKQIVIVFVLTLVLSMCNKLEKEKTISNAPEHSLNKETDKSESCLMLDSAEDSLKFISKKIEVKGEVETSLVLTIDSLKKMNVVTIRNFNVVCQSGAKKKENKTCKGVLLRDVLEKAKIKQANHKDRNFYIVARATDNYKATFSWAEIFNNPTGDNVYILIEEEGKSIQKEGEMILICKNDIKTGPRHVYWLSSIEIYRVD